ncbi:uncharacterized protein LOC143354586 [Halictus rubicundus]|uniref:uncharacterized protein LOC143354586 n=1 Tax=Halictus rubicundus TaxID=77578 RepID=UPI004036B8F4
MFVHVVRSYGTTRVQGGCCVGGKLSNGVGGGGSIRHGRSDRKVRVVGQVNDIRVYSYTGTLGNELTGAFRVQLTGEGSSRACRSARAFKAISRAAELPGILSAPELFPGFSGLLSALRPQDPATFDRRVDVVCPRGESSANYSRIIRDAASRHQKTSSFPRATCTVSTLRGKTISLTRKLIESVFLYKRSTIIFLAGPQSTNIMNKRFWIAETSAGKPTAHRQRERD